MKYIKTYESYIPVEFGSAWMIYGSLDDITKVLLHMSISMRDEDLKNELSRIKFRMFSDYHLIKNYPLYLGIILYYARGFSYSIIRDEKQKIRFINDINRANAYKLKGEIRLENGELVLDTFIGDVNKYNL